MGIKIKLIKNNKVLKIMEKIKEKDNQNKKEKNLKNNMQEKSTNTKISLLKLN